MTSVTGSNKSVPEIEAITGTGRGRIANFDATANRLLSLVSLVSLIVWAPSGQGARESSSPADPRKDMTGITGLTLKLTSDIRSAIQIALCRPERQPF